MPGPLVMIGCHRGDGGVSAMGRKPRGGGLVAGKGVEPPVEGSLGVGVSSDDVKVGKGGKMPEVGGRRSGRISAGKGGLAGGGEEMFSDLRNGEGNECMGIDPLVYEVLGGGAAAWPPLPAAGGRPELGQAVAMAGGSGAGWGAGHLKNGDVSVEVVPGAEEAAGSRGAVLGGVEVEGVEEGRAGHWMARVGGKETGLKEVGCVGKPVLHGTVGGAGGLPAAVPARGGVLGTSPTTGVLGGRPGRARLAGNGRNGVGSGLRVLEDGGCGVAGGRPGGGVGMAGDGVAAGGGLLAGGGSLAGGSGKGKEKICAMGEEGRCPIGVCDNALEGLSAMHISAVASGGAGAIAAAYSSTACGAAAATAAMSTCAAGGAAGVAAAHHPGGASGATGAAVPPHGPTPKAWTVKRCRLIVFDEASSDFLESDGLTVAADEGDVDLCVA